MRSRPHHQRACISIAPLRIRGFRRQGGPKLQVLYFSWSVSWSFLQGQDARACALEHHIPKVPSTVLFLCSILLPFEVFRLALRPGALASIMGD